MSETGKMKTPIADYRTLSDADFIRNLDILSKNYYTDYFVSGTKISTNINCHFYDMETDECVAPVSAPLPDRTMSFCGVYSRRVSCLILSLIGALIGLVYLILSFFKIPFLAENLSLFGKNILFFDPILSVFGRQTPCQTWFDDPSKKVTACILAAVCVVYFLFTVVTCIRLVVALCAGRRKDDTFRKFHFFASCLVWLICGLLIGGCALILKESVFHIGMIVLLLSPLVVLIFGSCAYRRQSFVLSESEIGADGRVDKSRFIGK